MSSNGTNAKEPGQNGQKRIWLPTELWVDTLKLLSRRQLLKRVQRTCRRMHYIAELHVPSVHVIHHFDHLLGQLECNQWNANRRLEKLMASEADLSRHFQLGTSVDIQIHRQEIDDQSKPEYKRRRRTQMSVLRHSLELFRGCQLHMKLIKPCSWADDPELDPGEYLAYLSLLAPARPFSIEMVHRIYKPELQADVLLRNPTVLACSRLTFNFQRIFYICDIWSTMPSAETICHWLHHLSTDESKAEQNNQTSTNPRIFYCSNPISPNRAAEIIERCKKSFQQSESMSDWRAFLFSFCFDEILQSSLPPPFKLENSASGEVLELEGGPGMIYHLWRCPVAELANMDKFYRDTFQDQTLNFRTPVMDNGLDAPMLEIC